MLLHLRQREITFPRRPLLMGIVNVNDDSFCDDGSLDPDKALAQAARLVREGADILDIGAESARTNRGPIASEEEVARLRPVLEGLEECLANVMPRDDVQVWPPLISVNTWRPEVAEKVLPLGIDILNDIGGLVSPDNALLCAQHDTTLLIMHTVGLPKVSHAHQAYDDLWQALIQFFDNRLVRAREAGLRDSQIILDPGIDFAKQRDDNLSLLQGLSQLTERYRCPVLLPISRKTVIGEVLNLPNPNEREAGTVACLVAGVKRGASIFRVHAVGAMFEALKVTWAVETVDQV